ncbi:MAG: ribosomal RNA small subunit methyltransferase A [Candidatus Dormibacteraeota bacterium]|nr:ribosomal RNA small subunit methyltransferase A [Candidatus Dormibacteraeota bacterium]
MARTSPPDLTDPVVLRSVMRRAGLRLDQRRGQHFLMDRAVLQRTVEALQLPPGAAVLEIGCGAGTLTVELAAAAARVVAVDVDPACVRAASEVTRAAEHVTVLERDARTLEPAALDLTPPWWAAGNLPYQLTGILLGHLFERHDPPAVGVFLLQREVAARLAATAGDWSLATVAIRSLAEVERLLDVPPDAFLPPPAVHSSLVRMRPAARIDPALRPAVLRLARAVFQQRRKTLRHGMTHALGDEAAAQEALRVAGVDSLRRPGTLRLDEWETLTRAVATVTEGPR